MIYSELVKSFSSHRFCDDILQMDSKLPEKLFHAVVTSPPYWQQRDYGHKLQLGSEKEFEDYICKLIEVGYIIKRTLRDDGTFWLNLGDKVKNKNQLLLPHRVALALQANGWLCVDTIIWRKPNALPTSVKDRTSLNYEYIFVFAKQPKYFYDKVAIEELAKTQSKDPSDPPLYRTRTSVWDITTSSHADKNGSTFPEELVSRMIQASTSANGVCSICGTQHIRIPYDTKKRRTMEVYTGEAKKDYDRLKAQNPSDTKRRILERQSIVWGYKWEKNCKCKSSTILPAIVLDPFIGSGTTATACEKLNRYWTGVDLIRGEDAKGFYQ
jgi:DNA modification methylase